jgi:hypothetical protein
MPDLPIDQLPSASALQPNNVFPVVQDNVTKQATYSSILYAPGNNYGLFNQTGSSTPVTNTIVETSLLGGGMGTLTVPVNGFTKGDAYKLSMVGHISSKNNDTLEIRIKAGSTLLADTGVLTMPATTNKDFSLNINFSIYNTGSAGVASISSGGTFLYSKDASNAFEGINFSIINSTTFNTTISNTLSITAQWSDADPLNNIFSEIVTLNKIY